MKIHQPISDVDLLVNKIVNGDSLEVLKCLPENFIDLIFVDPPYNLSKNYNGNNLERSG